MYASPVSLSKGWRQSTQANPSCRNLRSGISALSPEANVLCLSLSPKPHTVSLLSKLCAPFPSLITRTGCKFSTATSFVRKCQFGGAKYFESVRFGETLAKAEAGFHWNLLVFQGPQLQSRELESHGWSQVSWGW